MKTPDMNEWPILVCDAGDANATLAAVCPAHGCGDTSPPFPLWCAALSCFLHVHDCMQPPVRARMHEHSEDPQGACHVHAMIIKR